MTRVRSIELMQGRRVLVHVGQRGETRKMLWGQLEDIDVEAVCRVRWDDGTTSDVRLRELQGYATVDEIKPIWRAMR